MIPYYVINYNFNKKIFEPYEVMKYFIKKYNELETKPSDIRKFIEAQSLYRFWAKCEYEVVLTDWPCQRVFEKWDIHKQIMMNINIVVKIFKENLIN